MQINIKVEGIESALKKFDPQIVQRAAVRALNRAADSTKSNAIKTIRDKYNIKRNILADRMKVNKANKNKLISELVVTGKRLGLFLYGAREIKKGVSVEVIKGQRKLLKGAFIKPWRSGEKERWVFFRKKLGTSHQRRYKGKMRNVFRVGRVPREVLFGPSVPQLFGSRKVIEVILKYTTTYVKERFNHELEYELNRK